MAPFVALLIFVLLIRILVLTAAAVFELAGLAPHAARFEAVSALTTSGYTTTGSEHVVNHPASRRMASVLQLIGYLGPATVLGILGLGFLIPTAESAGLKYGALGAVILVGLALAYVPPLVKLQRALARRFAARFVRRMPSLPWIELGDHTMAAVLAEPGAELTGRTLAESVPDDVRVISVGRTGSEGRTVYVSDPDRSFRIEPADTVIVYGPNGSVDELRRQGARPGS
jgi:hypothetical protein